MKALRGAAAGGMLLPGGCVVYRTVPARGEARPGLRPHADSLSTARERELAALLTGDCGQQRPRLTWNPDPGEGGARARVGHGGARLLRPRDAGGNRAQHAGGARGLRPSAAYDHALPGNDVESAAEGYAGAATAWRHWMGSARHRARLLGLEPQFRAQWEFGIGYAQRPGSRFGAYWVVLIAEPGARRLPQLLSGQKDKTLPLARLASYTAAV